MPKGVGTDHTWPELCEADAWTTLGALFAAQVPSNEPATIIASRPIVLTMLPLRAQDVKNDGRPPIRAWWIFLAKKMARIGRNIGVTTERAEADHAGIPRNQSVR
jgi:hypothetical protein